MFLKIIKIKKYYFHYFLITGSFKLEGLSLFIFSDTFFTLKLANIISKTQFLDFKIHGSKTLYFLETQ